MQAEVLAVLRRRRDPLSAYDVLGELDEANPKIVPPTICRALSALTAARARASFRIPQRNQCVAVRPTPERVHPVDLQRLRCR